MKLPAVIKKFCPPGLLACAAGITALALLSGCAMPTIDLGRLVAPKDDSVVTADAAAQPGLAEAAAEGQVDPTAAGASSPDEDQADPGEPPADLGGPDLGGLVLFTSRAADPLATSDAGRLPGDSPETLLWAISADGTRAGRLSPEGLPSALVPVAAPENKPLILENGFEAAGDSVVGLLTPDECLDGACADFQFGLQGRTYAYLSGEDTCGRSLTLVERANGQVLNTWSGVAWYYFNADGGMIIAQGDCETRHVYQYIPNTDQQSGMAPDGELLWDPTHSAALVQVRGASPVQSELWGFNLENSRPILWGEPGKVMQDTPIWLADGRHFVYQHRAIRYDKNSGNAYLDGPRQIVLMDAWTRAQHLLAFDPGADFHLCATEGTSCDQPYGDWLKVRRTAFLPAGLKLGEPAQAVINRCALYGLDCPKPAEEYAVNWQTGEILPWADAGVPSPEHAPAFPPPDRAAEPVFISEDGSFALFTDAGGSTLWYVPSAGDPVLWVTEGENFVYVP